MTASKPPFGHPFLDGVLIDLIWVGWLSEITEEINAGWSGSFTNVDGYTVTVVNGKITDVS